MGRVATTPELITAGMARAPRGRRERGAALRPVGALPSAPLDAPASALSSWGVVTVAAGRRRLRLNVLGVGCKAALLGYGLTAGGLLDWCE